MHPLRTLRHLAPCLFASALAVAPLSGQSTVHKTATGTHTNTVTDSQTNTVTADKDKQGRPLPSPRHQLEFIHTHNNERTRIVISYGAPSVKGRKIYGELVPYGQWWRAGANEATSFVTDHTIRIGDLTVPAGSYTLDCLPGESGWQLIVNKQTGQWGTQYNPAQDLGRVPMTSAPLAPPQEVLSYHFDHVSGNTATLHLKWADKDESVVITYPGS
jgi:hypothetical protein